MGQVEVLAQENLPHMNALGSLPSTGGGGEEDLLLRGYRVSNFRLLLPEWPSKLQDDACASWFSVFYLFQFCHSPHSWTLES